MSPEKWMVGLQAFPFEMVPFQGQWLGPFLRFLELNISLCQTTLNSFNSDWTKTWKPNLWVACSVVGKNHKHLSYQMVVKSRVKNLIKSNSQNIHLKNQKTSYLINSDPTFNRNSYNAHIILLPSIGIPTSFGLNKKNTPKFSHSLRVRGTDYWKRQGWPREITSKTRGIQKSQTLIGLS